MLLFFFFFFAIRPYLSEVGRSDGWSPQRVFSAEAEPMRATLTVALWISLSHPAVFSCLPKHPVFSRRSFLPPFPRVLVARFKSYISVPLKMIASPVSPEYPAPRSRTWHFQEAPVLTAPDKDSTYFLGWCTPKRGADT